MKVSVVTISYNQGPFLERAIRSVIDQDYSDIEYIVVDPGSTDGSRDIIERYRDRIATVIYERDDGPATGLNKGFAVATGDVFAFVNADDALLPGAIRRAVAALRAQPDADVVYGHGYIVDENDRVVRHFFSDRFSLWGFAHGGVSVVQQSTFFRAEAFRGVGGFNPQNRTCWDSELWLDMALAGKKFHLVNEFWSNFRTHPFSLTVSLTGSGRLHRLYSCEWERLVRDVTGREPTRLDAMNRAAARIIKWGRNPRGLAIRLLDSWRGASNGRAGG